MTAAAAGPFGKVRRDPMAMLPFCGYHMGDYFRHWINMRRSLSETPGIFHVNWFRKGEDGKFLWPASAKICGSSSGSWSALAAVHSARRPPSAGSLATKTSTGMDWTFQRRNSRKLQRLDRSAWRREVIGHEELFLDLHDHLPKELIYERELLICRL
jgi:phosphoenolpyruvate carboxykinase (GTP)